MAEGRPRGRPKADSLLVAALLTICVSLGPISTDMYLASLPAMTQVFQTDVGSVQLTLSVFLVGFAIAQLAYGPLSDRFGRRPVMLGGIALYAAASVACALALTIETLILARLLQAIGACCGPVLGRAVVRDVYGPERAATVLAYMASAMALVPAAAPILGSVLHVWFGWQANFWVLTGFGVMTLLGIYFLLDETNAWRDPQALRIGALISNYGRLLRDPVYIGYVLTIAFSYSTIFAFISGSSFVMIQVLGVPEAYFGFCFAAVVLGYMAGSFTAGRLGSRFGIQRLILAGGILAATCGLTMALLGLLGIAHVATVLVPFALVMAGLGLIFPNAQAGAIGPYPKMAGTASALLGFLQMGLAALVGIGVGHWHDGTVVPMTVTIGLTTSLALASYLLLVRRRLTKTGISPGA
ncbi:MAG: multidrug effflux MFS transporter [Alphaproteobacteria bacterium]|nr:multidrug effflux MFS transporter [Alphaproteobacteria bacterium]MBU0798325.1 multidrug effflux MFS transporter [Alphaproteobacteria bacterium]MBU0887426.1 multidrug effflux MFS transporter [Alphaproteobacteria bacterium]MBU1813365.1 multidrug effflux MFS transporter [Alphaproteobacteria bacterium]